MLRKLAGFDVVSFGGAKLQWNAFAQSIGAGGPMPVGRDGSGYCLGLTNTGFGDVNFAAQFDYQATWGFHLDWYFDGPPTLPPNIIWWQCWDSAHPAEIIVSLQTRADNKMNVLDYQGHVAATSSIALLSNTWYTIEFTLVSAGGAFELRINGVSAAIGRVAIPGGYPDTINLRIQYLGSAVFQIDNYVIWDGQHTDGYDNFLGRVRINSLRSQADDNAVWTPKTGTRRWYQVREDDTESGDHTQGPDGDVTYIYPPGAGTGNADQLMVFEPSPCFGKVMAVSVNATCRPPAGDEIITLLYQGRFGIHALDLGHLVTPVPNVFGEAWPGYLSYQSLAAVDPDTFATWIDAAITNGSWGIRALKTARVYATQIWIEKLTSLTPQPYECGGGNYAY